MDLGSTNSDCQTSLEDESPHSSETTTASPLSLPTPVHLSLSQYEPRITSEFDPQSSSNEGSFKEMSSTYLAETIEDDSIPKLENMASKESNCVSSATLWYPKRNKWKVMSSALIFLGNGMNDAVPGALIPYMESYYTINYATVSLIFVGETAGFLMAALLCDPLDRRYGRSVGLLVCDLAGLLGSLTLALTPCFPVLVLGFFITGFGYAIGLSLNNVFAANLSPATIILGLLHGCYGVGGVIAPILGTAMVSNGIIWSRFYLILLGLRLISLLANGCANFRHTPRDASQSTTTAMDDAHPQSTLNNLRFALASRTTLIGALFVFCYQGAEVSLSGWIISYLITYRSGNPSQVGYVTSGFWGGVTLGRFAVTPIAYRCGERRVIYVLGAGCIILQLLIWLVPNVIGDAVAVSLLGLLLGPIYPCIQAVFTRLLPQRLHICAISFISCVGYTGGALAPFTTGLMAQALGTQVVNWIALGGFVAMLVCWFWLPKGATKCVSDAEAQQGQD